MAASCQKENFEVADGDYAEVSFTADLPGVATKAIADGQTVNTLYYEVYAASDETGAVAADAAAVLDGRAEMSAGKATVNVRLVKNKKYTVFFWAQYEDNANYTSPYNCTDLRNITVSYEGAAANDEKRDAFYAVAKAVSFSSAATKEVTLTRPFAQVNVATGDVDVLQRDGVSLTDATSTLTVTNVANTFCMFDNTAKVEGVEGELTAEFAEAAIPAGNLANLNDKRGNPYKYISMAYVLVPNDSAEDLVGASTSVSTIESVINVSGLTDKVTISYEGATLQRNHRTNLVGKLLTTSADYNVVVDDDFVVYPEHTYEYENVETPDEANAAFEKGETSVKINSVEEDATLVLPKTTEETSVSVQLPEVAEGVTVTFEYPADATAENKPETLYVTVPADSETSLEFDVPETTVYVNGKLQTVTASTAVNTLVVTDGSVIENLIVKKGNVRIEKGGVVNTISRDSENPDEMTTVYLDEGVETPEGASVENGFEVITLGSTWDGSTTKEPALDESTKTYRVKSAEELAWIAGYVNEGNNLKGYTVSLENNIDLDNQQWTPIGTEQNNFAGTFNGNGNSIKNLNIVVTEGKEGKAYIGLFGYAKDAAIRNVIFENVYLNIACLDIDHSQGHIGAVTGSLEGTSTIENLTVKGDIKVESTVTANGASRVAVVAGGNSSGKVTMKNVHIVANEGSYLKANNNLGALAGQLQGSATFENCSSNIDVTGTKFFAGGIIGLTAGNSTFTNCRATGDVTITAGRSGKAHDHYRVGGIAGGWADGAKNVCTLKGCTYTGKLSGTNADGSVAEKFDYAGYVGRGYTLTNCAGSTVIIDGVSYVQAFNEAANAGLYYINDVWTIYSASSLRLIAEKVNGGYNFAGKTVMLGNDIDLNNEEWTPIGTETNNFEGNFDGNDKVVKNLTITTHKSIKDEYGVWAYAGLFGVTCGAEGQHNSIKDFTIENVTVSCDGDIVAAAVAYPYYTDIENITVRGDVKIEGADYTAGVLGYTRRCINAKDLTITGNEGSTITGTQTVGGVISDIQMNGGLKANYSGFKASGLTITATKHVGGISGIISGQTLDGATVENVTIVCDDVRKGTVSGSLGETSTIKNVSVTNVTGADNVVGATYDEGAAVAANEYVYSKASN